MESPYNRPVAANLIRDIMDEIRDARIRYPDLCGFSQEMSIYTALKKAGYLTEAAMTPSNDEPKATKEPDRLCCGRTSKWDPCENRF